MRKNDVKTPVISVIIPVYNVERYLAECLDSVLSQTEIDIEILCVNDGSTDGSRGILETYSNHDGRIRIIDKENGGLSSARNAGFRAAVGKYIYYLDADDSIRPDAMSICKEISEKERLDILFFDADTNYENDAARAAHPVYDGYYIRKGRYAGVMSGAELFCRMVRMNEYRTSACTQFARKSFIEDKALGFLEGLYFEDNAYTLMAMLRAERAMHTPERMFSRRVRADSIVSSGPGADKVYSGFQILKHMQGEASNIESDSELRECIAWVLRDFQFFVAHNYVRAEDGQRQIAKGRLTSGERFEFALTVESLANEIVREK
ncbi:MAG: glycosyltransferase [Clostridiales bacterium]|nr:glycosyltransferase [Clostridiales bacterium]